MSKISKEGLIDWEGLGVKRAQVMILLKKKEKDAQKSLNFCIQVHFFIINLDPFLFFSDFRDWDKKSVFSAIALLGV